MRFSPSFLEEIRDRIPIADVVGRRVTFDRKKSNPSKGDFWACCPFHGEKTPSFHCENQKGRYHCFGCGVSGDHFRFLTKLDGLSFPEAVERLANEAGVAMPAVDPQAMEREQKKASLYDVMQLAVDFFRDQLQAAEGAKARAYLRDRRLSPAVQNDFQLGYAPSSRNVLKEYLVSKGVDHRRIEACGLVVFGPEIAVSYDRFRDRIMFPILDARSRPIAFGGRALSADVPAKYLNSPETELFSKSNVLYNYAKARKAVERGGSLIVCEGYIDVIALHAAGFETAVAPLGTALTEPQIELTWRVGGEPTLCFDGDEAGLNAAFRSIDTALSGLKPGRSLRFALLPEGEDPDDLIGRAGPEAFQQVLDSTRPLADMLWRRETDGRVFDTPEKRAELERTVVGVISQIGEKNVKRHYQQDMRNRLASFFGTVEGQKGGWRDQGKGPGGARRGSPARQKFAVSDSLMNSALVKSGPAAFSLRECVLLGTVLNHPDIGLAHFDQFAALDIEHPDLKKVHRVLLNVFAEAGEEGAEPSPDDVKNSVDGQGLGGEMALLNSQMRNNRIWQCLPEADCADAVKGWIQALSLYKRNSLRQELRAAELAYNEIGDEASLYRMTDVRDEISREEGTEALIKDFGLASGRETRSF